MLTTSELRLKILEVLVEEESCGYDIHKKLFNQGTAVDVGRTYKVLTEMLTDGILGCKWEKSQRGPEKRIYRLTDEGKKEREKSLEDAIETVHKHYSEYLTGLSTGTSIFDSLSAMSISEEETKPRRMGFFADKPSPMHNKILSAIQNRAPNVEVCEIHPKEINLSLRAKNLVSVNGEHHSIPLKDNYLDLLIIESLPSSKMLLEASKEWIRVTEEGKKIIVIAPTTLFSSLKDPLSIGDFIEKIEHQAKGEELGKGETLTSLLESQGSTVLKRQMLDMTFLIAVNRKTERR